MLLRYILVVILVFFVACSKEQSNNNEDNITKKNNINIKNKEKKLALDSFELAFQDNKLVYPNKRVILFFEDNSTYSKAQEIVLKKLKTKYIKVSSELLKNYFNVTTFPTIVVLDKNKTLRYENFVPYEILKAEGF